MKAGQETTRLSGLKRRDQTRGGKAKRDSDLVGGIR